MIVVSDTDYKPCMEKLRLVGFRATQPRRSPAAGILRSLPDPEKVLREINAEYAKLDAATTTFDHPDHFESAGVELVLMPASYAQLSASPAFTPGAAASGDLLDGQYDIYDNLHYPLERVLLESLIRVILEDGDASGINEWVQNLRAWISTMSGYLEVDNDAVDDCPDEAVKEWFSEHYGRKHEAKFGPWDRRISKRLGSGKEMLVDMRLHPVTT
ncbi:MAG: hypothetical protein M1832_001151 [Thelocarpon impressellum]|nr:MAG: hypothetical protein M1832_001151 [Thelocarpon impressellum]